MTANHCRAPDGLTIRQQRPGDARAVEALTREAFWNVHVPGCDEHYLVHLMHGHPDLLPALCFVAELDGHIVGNIMTTRSRLEAGDRVLPCLTFGPLSVHPDHQRRGIGRMLTERLCVAARDQGEVAIVIYGDPHNYVGAGFKNGKDLGVAAEDGSHPLGLLVRALVPGALTGHSWKVRLSAVYDVPPGAEAFDATFPPREKVWRPSQELFSMVVRARL
jgi:putative acetyltransferase